MGNERAICFVVILSFCVPATIFHFGVVRAFHIQFGRFVLNAQICRRIRSMTLNYFDFGLLFYALSNTRGFVCCELFSFFIAFLLLDKESVQFFGCSSLLAFSVKLRGWFLCYSILFFFFFSSAFVYYVICSCIESLEV